VLLWYLISIVLTVGGAAKYSSTAAGSKMRFANELSSAGL
jgi:hypothetical protein